MGRALRQPDGRKLRLRARESVAATREFERDGDILQRRHGRHQVKGLEDDPDFLAAKFREFVLAHGGDRTALDFYRTCIRPFEPGERHQERGLPTTGRPNYGRRLSPAKVERYVFEDFDPRRAGTEAQT